MRTEHESFAEELAERFETWRAPERHAELRDTFANRGAAELAEQFGRVEALLQGLEYTTEESLGIGASLVFGDAKDAALTAKTLCEMRTD